MRLKGNRIVIEKSVPERSTAHGLFLPSTIKETFNRGVVKEVSPDVSNISAGDQVIYRDGDTPSFDGQNQILIFKHDIYAVINN